jgi:sugar/nucleoside kinase (ribokinase family)
MTLDINEIDLDIIKHSYIFHFGSLSMTHEPAATATLETANFAKNNGCIVSYDPNFRMALWNSSEDAKKRLVKDYPMQMY